MFAWSCPGKSSIPFSQKMQQFAVLGNGRELTIDDFNGFIDDVSFPSECTSERITQNAFYCGYDCDTMIDNVFAYDPNRKIYFAAINFPGSWGDDTLTARFLHFIKKGLVIIRS